MNDTSETKHGLACLNAAYHSNDGGKFRALLDSLYPGLVEECKASFDASVDSILAETYIASISEHLSGEEDQHGRLSMWRAYGYPTGVALVLNPAPLLAASTAMNVYVSPVGYFRDDGYIQQLRQINSGLSKSMSNLRTAGKDTVAAGITNMFRFATICGKHPGFWEEREWRAVWCPVFGSPVGFEMSPIGPGGEMVCRVPMKNVGDLRGASLPEFIMRIIVGPCADPRRIAADLAGALEKAGVVNPASRIVCSDIPLRAAERVSRKS